jgi:uncharacterized protein
MKHMDSARFCKEEQHLTGIFEAADCPRLAAEVLLGSDFRVDWRADGIAPDLLELTLASTIQMKCQRCLNPMQERINVSYRFQFVPDEATAEAQDAENDEVDSLVHSRQFDLHALVEDEILMALPLVSLHEACPEVGAVAFLPANEKPNPFAILNKLHKNP